MSLSRLDLNLLLTLDAVLSEGSVARAAQRLNVTPSAVSNSLARLRLELNDPLVVRNGRGIVPTPRAAALAPTLKDALSNLERAVRDESFDPATTTRRFTLAIADAGQISQLPALAGQLAVDMPYASLRVVGIDTLLSWGGGASPEIDVAIVGMNEPSPGVRKVTLYEERGVLVANPGHPLAQVRSTKADLGALRHVDVQVAPGRGYRDLDECYARHGLPRSVLMIVPTFLAAAAVVAETNLVATLPESIVEMFQAQFGLVVLQGEAPTVTTSLNLTWHARTDSDPASCAFREIVKRSIGNRLDIRSQLPRIPKRETATS